MSVQTVDLGGLTATEARVLTDEIRQTLKVGHDLIIRAFAGRAWSALGYETWDAYCAGEFNDARMVRLDREQRREIVAEMRQAGMSTRAIASGIGVHHSTVAEDSRSTVGNPTVERPVTVTSLDGRQRPATQSLRTVVTASGDEPGAHVDTVTGEITDHPPAAPARQSPRRALPDAFFDAAFDLTKVTERIARLAGDDRFPQNAEKVAAKHRSDLLRAIDALQGVVDRLPSA